MSQIQGIPSS